MWGVTNVSVGKGTLVQRAITLHGLVDLVRTTELSAPVTTSSIIPLGKLIIPFSNTRGMTSHGFVRAISLEGGLVELGNPKSGDKFSYKQEMQGRNSVTFTGGLLGGNTTRDIKATSAFSCAVGEEASATTLHASFRGNDRPVSCEGEVNGNGSRTRWAYLLDSAVYFLLYVDFARGDSETYEIQSVEYVQ